MQFIILDAVYELMFSHNFSLEYLELCTPASVIVMSWFGRKYTVMNQMSFMPSMMSAVQPPISQASQPKGKRVYVEQIGKNRIREHHTFSINDLFDDPSLASQK